MSNYLLRICGYSGVAAGHSLCLYPDKYRGPVTFEEANFADILGIANERFKHWSLFRSTCSIAAFNFVCKLACAEGQ